MPVTNLQPSHAKKTLILIKRGRKEPINNHDEYTIRWG
jgi:hypothetical protein